MYEQEPVRRRSSTGTADQVRSVVRVYYLDSRVNSFALLDNRTTILDLFNQVVEKQGLREYRYFALFERRGDKDWERFLRAEESVSEVMENWEWENLKNVIKNMPPSSLAASTAAAGGGSSTSATGSLGKDRKIKRRSLIFSKKDTKRRSLIFAPSTRTGIPYAASHDDVHSLGGDAHHSQLPSSISSMSLSASSSGIGSGGGGGSGGGSGIGGNLGGATNSPSNKSSRGGGSRIFERGDEADKPERKAQLVFKKSVYLRSAHDKEERDLVAKHLLYVQACQDVIDSYYPFISVATAIRLAGLQLQIIFGDQNKIIAKKNGFALKEVEPFVPRDLLPLKKPSEWELALLDEHRKHIGKTDGEAKSAYLAIVKKFPLYGTTFYPPAESMAAVAIPPNKQKEREELRRQIWEIQGENNLYFDHAFDGDTPPPQTDDGLNNIQEGQQIIIGVNEDGIILLSEDKQVIVLNSYMELSGWAATESTFAFGTDKKVKYKFKTDCGYGIVPLIEAYMKIMVEKLEAGEEVAAALDSPKGGGEEKAAVEEGVEATKAAAEEEKGGEAEESEKRHKSSGGKKKSSSSKGSSSKGHHHHKTKRTGEEKKAKSSSKKKEGEGGGE